jgi:hypothetical protein
VQSTSLNRYLPHVAAATFVVLGLPALAASGIQAVLGVPAVAGVVLAIALSLALASAGSALWMRHPGSRDLVFGDLMVWGWLRRVRGDRRLAEATRLLGGKLSAGDRVEVLEQLAGNLEARDVYTHGHSRRVTRHAEAIALGMGLAADDVAKVRTAAAVHDVGKIFTPREVLMKPGRLTDVEFEIIKRHAPDGADMVAELGDREVTAMVRYHHERLDGSGYPDGLGVAETPVGARIIAVADTFDAMTSTRPYRRACSHKRAMDTLAGEAGTKLDPDAVAAFRAYYSPRSPVAWWSLLVTVPQRLVAWAGGALQGGAATLGAAALIGGGSIIGPTAGDQFPEASASRPAAAKTVARTEGARKRNAPRGRQAANRRSRPGERRLTVRRASPAGPRPHFERQPGRKGVPPQSPSLSQEAPAKPARPSQPKPPADPSPGVPPVQVPDVQQPDVRIPDVQVPDVQVPDVHVPGVDVPSVHVPPVHVPPVRVPPPRVPLPPL